MKKTILGIGLIVLFLAGCGGEEQNVKADSENAVNVLSKDDIGDNSISIIQDKQSGCKYMLAEYNHGGNLAITQMRDADDRPQCQ